MVKWNKYYTNLPTHTHIYVCNNIKIEHNFEIVSLFKNKYIIITDNF